MLKKSKLYVILAACLILCMTISVFLTGCGSSSQEQPAEPAPAEEPAAEPEEPAAEPEAPAAEPEEPAAEPEAPAAEEQKEIGEDKALEIAFKDSGVKKTDATNITVHLDVDDGRTEYDVEFHVGTTEYSYNIDPYTGDILEKDIDKDDYDD